ncbi:MAG: hypothetical protein SV253_06190 [Halobacteria archaeon]|nr:hypothetical protein [Halobacteria archaeon]
MSLYYFDGRELVADDRESYDEVSREIASRVVESCDVERADFRGLCDGLRDEDPDLFGKVVEAAGIQVQDPTGWCDGEVETAFDSLIGLFSPSLTRVVFESETQTVFGRYPDGQVIFRLSEREAESLPADVDVTPIPETRVSGAEGDGINRGVLQALMEETPYEHD